MQKLFLFVVLAFSLASCSNVGKHKDAIMSLSGEWDSATQLVTDLSGKVSNAQNSWNTMKAGMQITEELKSKLGEDALGQLTTLIAGNSSISSGFSGISQEVLGFISNWEDKGKLLTGLKDGLTAGKLEGDVEGTISTLTSLIGEGKEKVGSWEEKLGGTQSAAEAAFAKFQEIVSAVQ